MAERIARESQTIPPNLPVRIWPTYWAGDEHQPLTVLIHLRLSPKGHRPLASLPLHFHSFHFHIQLFSLSLSLSLFLSFSLSSFSPCYSFLRLLLLFIVIIIIIFRPEENIQIYLHHSTRCHHATLFHRIRGAINPLIMKILFNLQEFIRIPHRCVPVRFGSFDVGLSRSLALCDFRYPLLISCIVDMILIKRMTISERKPAILTCWTHGK